jgi:hypothetical protein
LGGGGGHGELYAGGRGISCGKWVDSWSLCMCEKGGLWRRAMKGSGRFIVG